MNSGSTGLLSYAQHLTMNGIVANANGNHGVDIEAGTAVISGLWASGNAVKGIFVNTDSIYWSGGDVQSWNNPSFTASKICAVKGVNGFCK